MIRSILVAVDASPAAQHALSYALFLSQQLGTSLSGVFVMDTRVINAPYWTDYGAVSLPTTTFSKDMRELFETQGKAVLGQVEEDAAKVGVTCRTELRTGIPATEILEAAQDADLIVIGQHGETRKLGDHPGLGAVAERVLRTARQPVLMAAARFRTLDRVLLGFDGSERARETMTYATELAVRLRLPMLAVSAGDDEALTQERLEVVRHYTASHNLEVITLAPQGDAVEAILGHALEGDLIAMGAFGEGRIREFLLGSTTESILRGSNNPVLLHR